MDVSRGVNMSDPVVFRTVVQHLIATLDESWIKGRLALLDGATVPLTRDEGSRLLGALAEYPDMLRALEAGQTPRDPHLQLFLATVAWVVSECSAFPGGDRFTRKLRQLAQAGAWDQFFDTLFEGEAALYWRNEMHATRVECPIESHPDFLATVNLAGRDFSIPNECKRIAPVEKRESELEGWAARLDPDLRACVADHGPIKIVVWLHEETAHISRDEVFGLITDLAVKALEPAAGVRWLTASHPKGLFQVSVANAGDDGELKERPIEIRDIPAVGPLLVRTKRVDRAQPTNPVALIYALSVRSDVVPNRIGALERNLNKAVEQVAVSTTKAPGSISVRIRPPRALGDLYEADVIVRRVLSSLNATQISLAVLFWNEGEREEEEWQEVAGQLQRVVTVGYGLIPYFIAHERTPIDFSTIDSKAGRFGSAAAIRDPETGSMIPVEAQFFEVLERTPIVAGDPTRKEPGAWMYLELAKPFPEGITRQAIQPIKTEERVFLPIFDDQQHVRFVEFERREPIRVATLDLRAWMGHKEFLFKVRWDDVPWSVSVRTPDDTGDVVALSSALRPVFA